MSDNRFKTLHYEDALQYTKDVLSSSSSIDEISANDSLMKERESQKDDE